jgi:hypothetical protein
MSSPTAVKPDGHQARRPSGRVPARLSAGPRRRHRIGDDVATMSETTLHPALLELLDQECPRPSLMDARNPQLRLNAAKRLARDPVAFITSEGCCLDLLSAFVTIAPALDDARYWETLGNLWVHHDRVHDQLRTWRTLFGCQRPERERLMREHELEDLAALPTRVEVFRGFSMLGGENGLAWTPDEEMALAFAERWAGHHSSINKACEELVPVPDDGLFIARAVVARQRIVALFRRESVDGVEVIIPSLRGYRRTVTQTMSAADLASAVATPAADPSGP